VISVGLVGGFSILREEHFLASKQPTFTRHLQRISLALSLFVAGATVLSPAVGIADTKPAPAAKPARPAAAASAVFKPLITPVRISYSYKLGDVRRYKVLAFLTGHFPPFAAAGSPPIHVMILLDYLTTVKKVTDKGAEVDFSVQDSKLCLLEKEPPADSKIIPDDAPEFPIPLSQVQQMFNAVATIKPNGAIANIQGGDNSKVKIDLGIDLRKLFLLTAPITFSDKTVKTGDEWPFDDGLLGSKAGKTTYIGHLESIAGNGKRISASIAQRGDSQVDSKLDKEGNSTDNASAIVGSLVGKVNLVGSAQVEGAADAGGASGRVTTSKLTMTVDLKRTLPDPDEPGKQQITDIDIKARFYVQPGAPASKPAKKLVASDSRTPSTGKRPSPHISAKK